jgi:hypothetical protein
LGKRLGIPLLFFAAAALAVSAYWLLFTTFMGYDDEGYVLISLKNYSTYGGLYAKVYSQYGPFFYFLHDVGHRLLGYEFDNTAGRMITLACWMITAGACAHLVWQQTKATALAGFTLTLTFFYLVLMIREPIHPGGIIAVLVALGTSWGASLISRRNMRGLAIISGLIGSALLFTKINVGVFFLMAAASWFVIHLQKESQARHAAALAVGLLLLLPLGLMSAELDQGWCRIFVGLSVVASLTMMSVSWRDRQPMTTWSNARWSAGAALVFGMVIIGAVCWRGTTLFQMVEGILLGPIRHPRVYHFPPAWKPAAIALGTLSSLTAILVWSGHGRRLSWLLVGLRLALTTEIILASVQLLPFTTHSSVMTYAVPWAWLFVLRLAPSASPPKTPNIASWIGLILVLQYLHAYPVAGTQIAWGTFLIIPLIALGLHDTGLFIKENGYPKISSAIQFSCLVLAVFSAEKISLLGWRNYTGSQPLSLQGAEKVRPPEDFAVALRIMALNASAHGDMLFSLPGMFSFNGWTQLPSPTLANTTHWFSLLKPDQQQEIALALSQAQKPVLIVNQSLLDYLTDQKFTIASPLHEYLRENFECAFKLRDYEFWVRKRRIVAPLGIATLLKAQPPQPAMAEYKLELVVAIPSQSKIARIELVALEDQPRTLSHWDKKSSLLYATGINLQGMSLTSENPSAWEQPLPPLLRLNLPLNKSTVIDQQHSVIYLRDVHGDLLAEARFAN